MIFVGAAVAAGVAVWRVLRTVIGSKIRIRFRRTWRSLRDPTTSSTMASIVSLYREEAAHLMAGKPGDVACAHLIMLLAALTDLEVDALAEDAVLRSERRLDERHAVYFYRSERSVFCRALASPPVSCSTALCHLERRLSALDIPRDPPWRD